MTKAKFRSAFLTDVSIESNYIELADSNGTKYYIDPSNETSINSFKSWFKNVFSKGLAMKPSVFKYSINKRKDNNLEIFVIEKIL